jgi:sugar phosphate isomerase/epimerase
MTAPLELCCYTVRQASFPELIPLAARYGFDTLTTTPWFVEEAGMGISALRERCDDAGVTIGYIDGLWSPLPGTPGGATEEHCFELAEGLGAPAVNVVHVDGPSVPFGEMADALAGVAERAASRGLQILIEFLPGTGIPDFPFALDLVREVGQDNMRVMLDTWHLARSGGGPEQLHGDAPALVGGLQVSDRRKIQDSQPHVRFSRFMPGEGELPLMDVLAPVMAAHSDLPIGIEVINDELLAMPADEVASVAASTLRNLLGREPLLN